MEFLVGGVAACGAGIFTNPLEVVKTRMQLQGELKSRGHYKVYYRNVFHAFYTIGRVDGLLALQKGLVPALWYQLIMNGVRLGVFESFDKVGFIRDEGGRVKPLKSVLAGGISGCMGAFAASPFYMTKIQLQSKASQQIAVGYQHDTHGMLDSFKHIYSKHGVIGLWRGVTAAIPRVMVGSAAQLTSFSWIRQKLAHAQVFHPSSDWCNAMVAAMASGVVLVAFMTPFDVVSTRIYNQGISSQGAGLLYKGFLDCFRKIFVTEGLVGLYKGWAASFFRSAPHTVLSLFFWDQLKRNLKSPNR